MARSRPNTPSVPASLQALVREVSASVTTEEIDTYGKLREIHDKSHRLRVIVKAWNDQQTQDRKLREKFARYLMVALAIQAVLVNVFFLLMGFGLFSVEQWTARLFVALVFGEIAALVLVVVKYLFAPPAESILRYLDRANPKE